MPDKKTASRVRLSPAKCIRGAGTERYDGCGLSRRRQNPCDCGAQRPTFQLAFQVLAELSMASFFRAYKFVKRPYYPGFYVCS